MNTFNRSIFEDSSRVTTISEEIKVVFVADLFAEDYVGGAELTTQALIEECPLPYVKIRSKELNMSHLAQGSQKFWIFGNFAQMNMELLPTIIGNLSYSILEYDYKYCRFRSPEKHFAQTGKKCDCEHQINGKLISAFYYGSKALWWMSEKQKNVYHTMFPFLAERDNVVLSSVFSKPTLGYLRTLRQGSSSKNGWIVLGSNSWVKGAETAKSWCASNNLEHEVVWNLPYHELLEKLSKSEGFVYLPQGMDTCPRMVIEAKLLGCKLELNDAVQHKDEEWFATDNLEEIEEYLFSAPGLFWNSIKKIMDYRPKISGYTTVYNAASQGYPFVQSILSMLQFCDEVCVVDGGSTDGTFEKVQELSSSDSRVKVKKVERDWNHPRFAVFDGLQKAEARDMCTGEYCWQMDCDEVVHEDDAPKVAELCKKFPPNVDIISLPVTEYWGGPEKVRVDILPWKWRLSRNKKNITHGIPRLARRYDTNGHLYAQFGDGCDMIDRDSHEVLPHVTFYTGDVEKVRRAALDGDDTALNQYAAWFNNVIDNLPGVFHYSWFDLERKIKLYKNYWTRHWESLSGKKYEDTAESNMMFDVPWNSVTDEMIRQRAGELREKLGGWVWHKKWDGTSRTPHITVSRAQPKLMLETGA